MLSAVMFSATGMFLPMMSMSVMIATNIRVITEITREQSIHSFVRAAGYTSVKPDSGFLQRRLCTCTNSAADQRIHFQIRKQYRQSAVAASVGTYHLRVHNLSILNFIKLELLCMPKMLKYISIFKRDCHLHNYTP